MLVNKLHYVAIILSSSSKQQIPIIINTLNVISSMILHKEKNNENQQIVTKRNTNRVEPTSKLIITSYNIYHNIRKHQQEIINKRIVFLALKVSQKISTNRISKRTQSESKLINYAKKKLKKVSRKKTMMIWSWKTKKKTPTKLKEESRQDLWRQ